jgi:predicted RNA-binding Zn-ribbon protein involved in translation (DUF1610 family)
VKAILHEQSASLYDSSERFGVKVKRALIRPQIHRKKIDLQKIRASLDTTCTLCGFAISPADVQRIDFDHILCPKCGKDFVPTQKKT